MDVSVLEAQMTAGMQSDLGRAQLAQPWPQQAYSVDGVRGAVGLVSCRHVRVRTWILLVFH